MTTDILEINDFVILVEQSFGSEDNIQHCSLNEEMIGFSFYYSGMVNLTVDIAGNKVQSKNSSGLATSFFGNRNVHFTHNIDSDTPLQCVSIFSTMSNIDKLSSSELNLYQKYLPQLLDPQSDFVLGPHFYMSQEMRNAISKILNCTYQGAARLMFIKSQSIELLSHFFAQVSSPAPPAKISDIDKIHEAQEIINNNLVAPPSLNELSKMIGLNSNKLKKNFKALFGVPVFKYLQNERLRVAYELLNTSNSSIQEVAWDVGYDSVSSFSNAFKNKYGVRPSKIGL